VTQNYIKDIKGLCKILHLFLARSKPVGFGAVVGAGAGFGGVVLKC
jgi:hypothetical protein